jgi:hypothetical protein
MCIWKCCVFAENMDKRDRVTTSSKEQMRSSVRVRVQGEITSKGGKDQGATTDHLWGLRHKVWTSYEKTPYLDRRDDDLKMTQMKGAKCKMSRWDVGRKMGPNRAEKTLGRPAWSDRPRPFLPRFVVPFDLAPPRSINSSLLRRPPHPTILPTPFTRKPPPQDEGGSWMSSSQGLTPAEGRKQEENSKLLA